jgi:hypothetical protein
MGSMDKLNMGSTRDLTRADYSKSLLLEPLFTHVPRNLYIIWVVMPGMVDTPYVSRTVLMKAIFQSLPGREPKMGDNDSWGSN